MPAHTVTSRAHRSSGTRFAAHMVWRGTTFKEIAGVLGHRYAVAYGLALLATT